MSNFPKLVPALTLQIALNPPTSVGTVASGQLLQHVAFVPGVGFLRSEPAYPINVDATILHGADFIRSDPDGAHIRLKVDAVLHDGHTDSNIRIGYTGIIDTSGEMGKVLSGAQDVTTTSFGENYSQFMFEASSAPLKSLEYKVFVGTGHFIIEQGAPIIIEYKISEVQ